MDSQSSVTSVGATSKAAASQEGHSSALGNQPALRLLAWIGAGIISSNILSLAIFATGLPLSRPAGLAINSVLTVALLFVALHRFVIAPLLQTTTEVERKSAQLDRVRLDLEHRLTDRNAELAETKRKLEIELTARQKVDAETRLLGKELDNRVAERTASLEGAIRQLQMEFVQQKVAAEAVRQSEELYRRLVQNANAGVWRTNVQGRIDFINPRGAELLGCQIADILGRSPEDFLCEEDLAKLMGGTNGQQGNRTELLEFRVRHKNGAEGWLQSAGASFIREQGKELGTVMVFSDCMARRRADRTLREYAALLQAAQDAIVMCDSSLCIQSWNQGAQRLYGWTAEEALGRDLSELLADRSAPIPKQELLSALRQRGQWRGELSQVARDKRRLTIEARWSTVAAPGQAGSILLVATDMTLRQLHEAKRIRQERMETASSLISGLAHELNTNLAPILLSTEMLRSKPLEMDDYDLLTTIETSAERSADLLKEALVYARGVEGERVLIHPTRLLSEILHFAREIFSRNVQVLSEIQEGLWTVKGDPSQLQQVILKLCVNARDAMQGGGTFCLKATNINMDQAAANSEAGPASGSYVALEFRDTGTAIDCTDRDRVFEPFFISKERGGRSGFGLSTALGIVRSHGGTIDVKSQPGGPTAFVIYLPAAVDATNGKSREIAPDLEGGRGEWILMVEDEAGLRDVTKTTLSRAGYHVLTAADGIEALGLLAQHQGKIKLIFTTISMPAMDGPALARAARKIDPRVRIIASSALGGSVGQADKLAALQSLGIGRLLAKPYTAHELLGAVRDELHSGPAGLG